MGRLFGPSLNSNFCLFHLTQSNFEANLETKHAEQSNWLFFRSQAGEYVNTFKVPMFHILIGSSQRFFFDFEHLTQTRF